MQDPTDLHDTAGGEPALERLIDHPLDVGRTDAADRDRSDARPDLAADVSAINVRLLARTFPKLSRWSIHHPR